MDPIERIDPDDPIDSSDPAEPSDRIEPADIALRHEKTLPTDKAQYADHVLRHDALDAMTTPNQKAPRHIPAFRPPLGHA